ncbi:G protein alpha subunit [Rhizoctonia solani]|uniref:G protein alpha subunit n=1 Tax=Rhizoctonia solani TaxID=456999 RepID=A0A8H7LMN8_9AGAM|nr:G protein alpha subunit [Rhizoctonia solani]
MPSRRTTPSPTFSRPRIPLINLWPTQASPSEECSEPVWDMSDNEAKKRSDIIDQALKTEKVAKAAARRKQRKVLVVGQSESGKSTLVKQFRLKQSPEAFAIERESWKSIIYLNIVRSILKVIDTVAPSFNIRNPTDLDSQSFARLRLRLMPLRSVEESIIESLSSPKQIPRSRNHKTAYSSMSPRSNGRGSERGSPRPEMDTEYDDVFVHPESPWQRLLQKCMRTTNAIRTSSSFGSENDGVAVGTDDPAITLEACAADMKLLWSSAVVHQCLKEVGFFIEDMSGFFLNDIERITSPGYIPTDDDILRSRVKTIAPTETILPNLEQGLEWRMCRSIYAGWMSSNLPQFSLSADDVGGARRQRAKWAPFFDDMDLLIVIVPVSAFDQYLAEDHSVNRLQDSFEMWNELCKATALHHIPVLLFLNKTDILEKKLRAGIKLSDYLINYGDRLNEPEKALRYLTKSFIGLRRNSKAPKSTPCYIHRTSDRTTTQTVIGHVRDQVVIGHMKESYFV